MEPELGIFYVEFLTMIHREGALAARAEMEDRELATWREWIGRKVSKGTKPFKSGLKVNTIKGVTRNPHTNRPAFTFNEDTSIVECRICNAA